MELLKQLLKQQAKFGADDILNFYILHKQLILTFHVNHLLNRYEMARLIFYEK